MIGVDVGAMGGTIGGWHNNVDECTVTQQPAREQGGTTRGVGVNTSANERHFHNKSHEEAMEVADAMATTEEDAAGVGTVAAG